MLYALLLKCSGGVILRRALGTAAAAAVVAAVVLLMMSGSSFPPGPFELPGATAEPTGPPGPGGGSGPGFGGNGGSQFQPPGWPQAGPGYSGGNYPAPPQGNGIDINNPGAAPEYSAAPQYPQQQQPYPTRQAPVHGTMPPNYDAPPGQIQQQPAQPPPTQQPSPPSAQQQPNTPPQQQQQQQPAQQDPPQQSDSDSEQDQAARELQRRCEDMAQLLGIIEQVMTLPANVPSGDLRNGPGRSVGGGIGACGLCPPQQGPQQGDLAERPIRPRPTTIRPRPIEDPNFDQTTAPAQDSPFDEDYCSPARNGGSNLCRNVVKVCFAKGGLEPTVGSELRNERALYLSEAESLRKANGGTLTRRSTKALENRKRSETRLQRKLHPELYEGTGKVPGHMPDLTWAPGSKALDEGRKILPMDASLNASIGEQANRYPIGFVAEQFVAGTWITDFNGAQTCM